MALVRAIVTIFDKGRLYLPGDVFEFDGEIGEGMELITKKSLAAVRSANIRASDVATQRAKLLREKATVAQDKVNAMPGRTDLVAEAATAYAEALTA